MAQVCQKRFVWDLPTRLFHWLLVGLLVFSWWSAETHHMDWHRYAGITVCALIVFRLLWGVIGTSTARFTQFVKGPRKVWSYVRLAGTDQPATLGHNPMGGWSVIVLLLMVSAQLVSGLFAVDVDGLESGPLSDFVDFDQGRWAAKVHAISFNVLLALVGIHIAAVLFYLFAKRRNLISAMITGFQPADENDNSAAASVVPRWRLAAAVIASILVAYAVSSGFRF
jgi:cytochrome b